MIRVVCNKLESMFFTAVRAVVRHLATPLLPQDLPGPWLVIAPHPDDETLGCGATIMQARGAGKDVNIVLVTDGRHATSSTVLSTTQLIDLRKQELLQAVARLDVPSDRVSFLDFTDGQTTQHQNTLQAALAAELARLMPQTIFSPSGIDRHPDHRAIATVMTQLRAEGKISATVYEYPIWFWSFKTWLACPHAVIQLLSGHLHFRRVTATAWQERKRQALAAHCSQLENLTGEASWQTLTPFFLEHFFDGTELFLQSAPPHSP
jgi:LmbE family N-acetylglucosaminyl deacetylase